MVAEKLISLLIANPHLEIEEDNITSITVDEEMGLVSIKGECKHPLNPNKTLTFDEVLTSDEVEEIIKDDESGKLDEIFGLEEVVLKPGTQSGVTELKG